MENITKILSKITTYKIFCDWVEDGVILADKTINPKDIEDAIDYGVAVRQTVYCDLPEEDGVEFDKDVYGNCFSDDEFIITALNERFGDAVAWVKGLDTDWNY